MGWIRLLLALSVVAAHFPAHSDLKLVGGVAAVKIFFLISGYYVSLIYTDKYHNNPVRFWVSRYLRLAPVYFFCCLFSISKIVKFLASDSFPILAKISILFTSGTMFFQDLTCFFSVTDGSLAFINESNHSNALSQQLFLIQGWSLGAELTFYLLTPLFITKWSRILAALFLSVLVNIYLFKAGLGQVDPWEYRFFPAEFSLFVLGVISQKVNSRLFANLVPPLWLGRLALIAFTIIIGVFPWVDCGFYEGNLFLVVTSFLLIPLIFNYTKTSNIDSRLASISYPIYCFHIVVLKWISKSHLGTYLFGNRLGTLVVFLLVILFGFLIAKFIELPFDRVRRRLVSAL